MIKKVAVLLISLFICIQSTVFAGAKPAVIRYGMKGKDVKTVQNYLVKAKFLNGKADGVFDQKTLDAVKQFQLAANLKSDGIVGPVTMKALKDYKPPKNVAPNKLKLNNNNGRMLRVGMSGDDVKLLQNGLIKHGFLTGKPDGVFGQATLAAVKEFQQAAKLQVDGLAGKKTLDALKAYKPPKKGKKSKDQSGNPIQGKPPQNPAPAQPEINTPQLPRPVGGHPANWRPISLEATAYTRYDEGCTDYTYRGTYLRRGLVAVDPEIIPLGTHLYIPDYGYAVADDIGGAIQGHKIDLAMETLAEAFDYGRRRITAYIIEG
jgi:3D (Asp-Asp-Asp) domain-containing protein/peptidoglycan hydrolase-like protein with peptidoglycan-binding domain